ncbi:MAG: DMT family transporter [Spirochaetales bacterium]|nr:DMT family transporter [Spirochaetales bacterium]
MSSHKHTVTYILAALTIVVWSSTFISTKILLASFTPAEILLYRFTLAWVCMFAVYPRIHRWPKGSLSDTVRATARAEFPYLLAGITGGSLYFLAENYALRFSLASNVSLLVSTAPILTAIIAHFFLPSERLKSTIVSGALLAFAGAALVILNGTFVLRLHPAGDLLALSSALCWAFYSVIIKKTSDGIHPLYLVRKIFFYTILTMLPLCILPSFRSQIRFDFSALANPVMAFNLIFLTLFASCGAYVSWNRVIKALGATRANTFIYFIPLLTLLESAIILKEPLTLFALGGAALILFGVYRSKQ